MPWAVGRVGSGQGLGGLQLREQQEAGRAAHDAEEGPAAPSHTRTCRLQNVRRRKPKARDKREEKAPSLRGMRQGPERPERGQKADPHFLC